MPTFEKRWTIPLDVQKKIPLMAICSKGFLWKINPQILWMPRKTKRSGEHNISHIFPSSNHRQISRNPAETLLQPGTCATGSLRTRGLGIVISLRTLLKRHSVYRTIPMGLHGIVHTCDYTWDYYTKLYYTILLYLNSWRNQSMMGQTVVNMSISA